MSLSGIDVSHFQGKIDWASVSQNPTPVSFSYVKATEGINITDAFFNDNYAGLQQQKILHGAYLFFHPNDSIAAQVALFKNVVGALRPGDLPPALDVEINGGLNPVDLATSIQDCLAQLTTAFNCSPIIYTDPGFWNANVGINTLFNDYALWVADQTTRPTPTLPRGATGYLFWQNSATGKVAGISQPVDLDLFNGTLDQLNQLTYSGS